MSCTCILYLTVASAPDSLSLKQDGETTVIISWTVPAPPGDTTGYRVYYTTDNMIEIIVDSNSSPITLTSLEPLNEYEISVVGLSEHISSEPITLSIFLGEFINQQYTFKAHITLQLNSQEMYQLLLTVWPVPQSH